MTGPQDETLAVWFHGLFTELAAARRTNDTAAVNRIRDRIAARDPVHGQRYLAMVDKMLWIADERAAGRHVDLPIGFALPGELMCDFCASLDVVCYFPFDEFSLEFPGGEWRSGDEMYTCVSCRVLVEAGNWAELRKRVGPSASELPTRLMWMGFQQNRTGPPVDIDPTTHPRTRKDG